MKFKGIDKDRLIKVVGKFRSVKALVIGDVILDHYIFGAAERLSPEAPVPVVWARNENYLLGGASNVSHNITSLGAAGFISGVIGNDFHGTKVNDLLDADGINRDFMVMDKNRPTTLKTRILAQHQQVLRIDWESCEYLDCKTNDGILDKVRDHIDDFDVIIIEDYGKGVINPVLVRELVALCKKNKKIVTVDPKEEHLEYYEGVTALTPNLKEAQTMANFKARNDNDIDLLGDMIVQRLAPEGLLLTLGEKGMKLFRKDGSSFQLPTYALEVFDVSGAGDTVIAVFSLALAAGATFEEAATIANVAAGIVVGKLGVSVTNVRELKDKIAATF